MSKKLFYDAPETELVELKIEGKLLSTSEDAEEANEVTGSWV